MEVSGVIGPSPALVTQQEVGDRVRSFEQGLNDALRKKPDIILVGEIRTAETLRIALEAVETGHFILSTMHTRGEPGKPWDGCGRCSTSNRHAAFCNSMPMSDPSFYRRA